LRVETGGRQNDQADCDPPPDDGWECAHNYFVTLFVSPTPAAHRIALRNRVW
jgi:hypothetical protein